MPDKIAAMQEFMGGAATREDVVASNAGFGSSPTNSSDAPERMPPEEWKRIVDKSVLYDFLPQACRDGHTEKASRIGVSGDYVIPNSITTSIDTFLGMTRWKTALQGIISSVEHEPPTKIKEMAMEALNDTSVKSAPAPVEHLPEADLVALDRLYKHISSLDSGSEDAKLLHRIYHYMLDYCAQPGFPEQQMTSDAPGTMYMGEPTFWAGQTGFYRAEVVDTKQQTSNLEQRGAKFLAKMANSTTPTLTYRNFKATRAELGLPPISEEDFNKGTPSEIRDDKTYEELRLLVGRWSAINHVDLTMDAGLDLIERLKPFLRTSEPVSSEPVDFALFIDWLKGHIALPVDDEFKRGWNAAMQTCLLFVQPPATSAASKGEG